jgi:hypothetical protein
MSHQIHCLRAGIHYGLLVVALGTCNSLKATDAFTALQISQVQVIDGADCSVPGTATTKYRTQGIMDVGLPDSLFNDPPQFYPYWLPLLVMNNLASAGASKAEEMNNITLTHFSVELSAPGVNWDKDLCPSTFDSQPMTVLLSPGGATGASLNIITAAHAQCLQSQVPPQHVTVTATITAKGRHGGTSIDSSPFTYPVDVCIGCLQTNYTVPELLPYRYPANMPMCAAFAAGTSNPYSGDTCAPPGQDKTIFCCGITITTGVADAGAVTKNIAVCPGVFTGTTSTATSTSTSTSTSTTTGP